MLSRIGLFRIYYLAATPVFLLIDELFGAEIRVAALGGRPSLKYLYYALCLALGVVMRFKPAWSEALALLESSVNIGLLIAGILLPYYRLFGAVAQGNAVVAPIDMDYVANFVIAATIWAVSFYRNPLIRGRN